MARTSKSASSSATGKGAATSAAERTHTNGSASSLALWLGWPFWRGPGNGWVHAKLTLVVAVIGFHHMNARLLRGFERADNRRSHVWFRVYNEISVLLFAAIVALVVFKPF